MRVRWRPLAGLVVGYTLVAGCFVGSRSGGLAPFEDEAGGSSAGGDGGNGLAGPGGGHMGGSANGAGFPDGGFPDGSGGMGAFGGSIDDGGFGGGGGAGGGIGGMGGSTSGDINCTTETCMNGEVCCFDDDDMSNNFCAPSSTCGGGVIEISCQNPSDCPGSLCCAVFDFAGMQQGYEVISCDPVCDPPDADQLGLIMCGDDPSVCPGGPQDCVDSATLPDGFMYCDPT